MRARNRLVGVALTAGLILAPAEALRSQVRRPRALPPRLSVRVLKTGVVEGRSGLRQQAFDPGAAVVAVEVRAPAAGITARIDRDSTTARAGDRVVPAAFVFIAGGDSGIVDVTTTRESVAREIVIGTDTYQALGPMLGAVLDLRQGDYVEYRFLREGVLRLGVVFAESPANLTSVVVAGQTFDVARTRSRLGGEWAGSLAWRGGSGSVRFRVDSNSAEVGDLAFGFSCRRAAGPPRTDQPAPRNDVTLESPAWPVIIGANNTFEFGYMPAEIGSGTGRFVTPDSAVGTLRGSPLSCGAGRPPFRMSGAWSARRSGPWTGGARYSFRSDSVQGFSIRVEGLPQSGCFTVREGDLVLRSERGGWSGTGAMEFVQGAPCIWAEGAIHEFSGEHTENVTGRIRAIRAIRGDIAAPLRFRVDRTGYVYLGGRGTVTLTDGRAVELPLQWRLVAREPQVASTRQVQR